MQECLKIPPGLRASEQLPYRNAKRLRDFLNVDEADVPFTALDATDVRPVEIADESQCFLRKPFGRAQLAYALTECRLDRFFLFPVQAIIKSLMMTLSPRTLSIIAAVRCRPRGKVDLSATVRRAQRVRGRVRVRYEELSRDILHNRIVKTTMRSLAAGLLGSPGGSGSPTRVVPFRPTQERDNR